MPKTVLMVAEKPSLAENIAFYLSNGRAQKHQRALRVFEFDGFFMKQPAFIKVTSTIGHVFSCDFTPQHQNWDKTEEEELFNAPVMWKDTSDKVTRHLEQEAQGCDELVLWLDCDREGENICFEVMQVVQKSIYSWNRIWRAIFSAITYEEISRAYSNLVKPNKCVSDAVRCRQILDLKVGVAFTRCQTKFFQGKYGDLNANIVSYGPCQTPTLGFCVQRHDDIVGFKPENYWKLVAVANRGGALLQFEWERGRVFDETIARLLHQKVTKTKIARVVQVTVSSDTRARPTALNTVEMLKVATKMLGIGPHYTMNIAEGLYIRGYISYPRTESTAYPNSFNFTGVLQEQKGHSLWGGYVTTLLEKGHVRPKAGKDAGDHPPITPMRVAGPSELSGDEWRLYEYITRHFIATLSPDCKLTKTKITIDLHGEVFHFVGSVVDDPGFTAIMPHFSVKDDRIPANIARGDDFHLSDVRLQSGQTQAPEYLTEADLIGLMEKNGIGTDASIPTHINNITEGGYCTVEPGRQIKPTKLGIVLIHGIKAIDPELVLPMVRSRMEEYVTLIAEDKAQLDDVLSFSLKLFFAKFKFFKEHIDVYDSLMSASFSALSTSGKPITRCGNCSRYLKHITARPQRLYCAYCEVIFNLPQGGTIRPYSNFVCPRDQFELVICHIQGGKSFSLCPQCFNHPPLEELEMGAGRQLHLSCDMCHCTTCEHSLARNYVSDCIDEGCQGSMAFVPRTAGNWRICCNHCNMMVRLPPTAQRVRVTTEECEECGASLMEVVFPPGKSPLPNSKERLKGCVYCDAALCGLCEEVRGRTSNFNRGRGRRRGRGRGRGWGRGRGRGDN